MTLTIKAPAKINWFLEIKGKRPDGYHEILTIMQAVSLYDEINIDHADDLQLTCDVDLGPPETNLVYRAAALMRQQHAPGRGAHIHLTKRIPHGAGLGGGSSDAANALVALDRLWGLNLGADELRRLVSQVGSDCAFFVDGGTAQCTGRGEIVEQLPDIVDLHMVLLYPDDVCPTPLVYADLSQHLTYEPLDCYFFHQSSEMAGFSQVAGLVMNRLQESALRVSKKLREVWEVTAHEEDVAVRFVSGSGSTIVFLMPNCAAASSLKQKLSDRALGRAFAVQTVPRGAVWG
jgi:4-diphosphocytidyl-2-C-methyl-D-erythritol kinase